MCSHAYLRKACKEEKHANQDGSMFSGQFDSHRRKNYTDVNSAVSEELKLKWEKQDTR